MPRTLVQKVLFKNTSPSEVYQLYMHAFLHTDATGAVAEINSKEGVPFSAYDGYITGANLKLDSGKLIVQSWRASDWQATDPDSTLMLYFAEQGANTVLHMVHSNIPDNQADALNDGWNEYYWKPWRKYLAERRRRMRNSGDRERI